MAAVQMGICNMEAWIQLTCSSSNAKAEKHSTEDAERPHKEQARADDVLRGDLLRKGLSKVHNHAH